MAYIGKQPVVGNFVKLDAIVTSATATYNLLNGGVAYFPQTANNCIVSLNGVIQSPTSAYTISGSTIVFDSALTSSDSIDFILVLGDVLAIGTPSDGTVTSAKLASGVAGLIAWQSIVTAATLTAVAGRGYWINTTSNACTVTLPASATAGDTIILVDYARNWGTNAVTINQNSLNFQGSSSVNPIYNTNLQSVTIVYSGATQGWIPIVDDNVTYETAPPYSVDFLVIAGGGSGGSTTGDDGGGAGAGGYRTSSGTSGGGGTAESSLTFNTGTVYTITVGAGGSASGSLSAGNDGSNSVISGTGLTTITSIGGGGGGANAAGGARTGGSGGGAGGYVGTSYSGGAGTANQGYAGGNNTSSPNYGSGGGGGAGAVGANGTTSTNGAGGTGVANSLTGSSVTRAGGGGGGGYGSNSSGGAGGTGGGGNGGNNGFDGVAGTVNTGGGGGGGANAKIGGAGGSGVVILSMPDASYSGTTTGSPTVATGVSGKTVLTFTASGTYTA